MITMPAHEQRRHPSLTAESGTPGDARAAMKALENHGIDGLEITVLDGPEDDDRRPADRRDVRGHGAAVLGVVGVIAAIAGAPAVLIAAFVVLGAGLGAAVGAFWGVERGVGMSEDWEKTFEEPASATKPMRIGVYTNGDAETMRARHVLERHRPLDIQN